MKFDVVIGNPPYNNDLYLDFVQTGYNLLKDDGVMVQITPAKWQAKGGKKNEDFRANIVPHMKEIKYFRSALDVFPDTAMCGDAVCYYKIDKSISTEKNINGVQYSNWQCKYGFDKDYISICEKIVGINTKSLYDNDNIVLEKSYYCSKDFCDYYYGDAFELISTAQTGKIGSDFIRKRKGYSQYKVYLCNLVASRCVPHIYTENQVAIRQYVLVGFGDKALCESIASYISSKLIWYLVFMQNTGSLSRQSFINVPDPGQFDHIFTDDELYKKYNLTQDEINIIESVIKERK